MMETISGGDGSVTTTTEVSTNGAATLSRTSFPGYVGHVTVECPLLRAV